jgi:hypothetical protein
MGREMAETPGSKDKSFMTLDLIINILKEHEQILDKSIHALAMVTEQIGDQDALKVKMENVGEKINLLKKEIDNLTGHLSNDPVNGLSSAANMEESLSPSQSTAQSELSMTLCCKQWGDFQFLAKQAQTLTFSINASENVFQAEALKGNQIITYTGTMLELSPILKTLFSQQIGIPESNVIEGHIGKSK